MKIGIIFECAPKGADQKVCEYLAKKICEDIEIISVTLYNKKNLLRDAASRTATLLQQGCSHVLIIWDLDPPWKGKKQKSCRHEDRQTLLQSLEQFNVPSDNVSLICIEKELEAWLLADERALSEILSRSSHQVRVPKQKNPERIKNPKAKLRDIYRQEGGLMYNDVEYPFIIVQKMPDLIRIKKACATFRRFEQKLLAVCRS